MNAWNETVEKIEALEAHVKAELEAVKAERDARYAIHEGHRQMVLLAIAEVAIARPGWVWALTDIAENLRGRDLFDKFRSFAKVAPLMLATEPERVDQFGGAVEWLKEFVVSARAPSASSVTPHAHAVYLLEALGQLEPGPSAESRELEELRAWKAEATASLEKWHALGEELRKVWPVRIGSDLPSALLDHAQRLASDGRPLCGEWHAIRPQRYVPILGTPSPLDAPIVAEGTITDEPIAPAIDAHARKMAEGPVPGLEGFHREIMDAVRHGGGGNAVRTVLRAFAAHVRRLACKPENRARDGD